MKIVSYTGSWVELGI